MVITDVATYVFVWGSEKSFTVQAVKIPDVLRKAYDKFKLQNTILLRWK